MASRDSSLDAVRSADGTSIAIHRSGSGTPLLLVHGALSDHTAWDSTAPLFAEQREVFAIDRRGHPPSGGSAEYKPEREVDDLFAASMGLHTDVDVLAHSSGAVIALRAAERGLPVRRLVLYEPPIMQLRIEARLPRDLSQRIDALIASGDPAGAIDLFLRNGPQLGDTEIDALHNSRRWPAFLEMAPTVAYDARVVSEYAIERGHLAVVQAPVLFLVGSDSPPWYRRGIDAIDHLLPNSRILVMPGEGHNAMYSSPELLAAAVTGFLDESGPDGVFQLGGAEKPC
ncbi:MAG TPA: alpha/beta hydrolase [Dehalococcoidia bacterium]|nr:alpha/beta hydrolase [Dehalococcoidia bacterium]